MNKRVAWATLIAFAMACASTTQPPEMPPETMHGVASWYGEEFAGRTTANGEIFDPLQFTAAHRTLPFGTVLDITNPMTRQTVRVRINDRGPYIGGRIIDLSYAAAKQIGLVEPGIGEINFAIVKMGGGEREPPAPLEVTIAEAPVVAPMPSAAQPEVARPSTPVPDVPVVVDRVEVTESHGGVETRRQVSADGRSIETVAVESGETVPPAPEPAPVVTESPKPAPPKPAPAPARRRGQFIVQVGAFAVEENAKLLQARLVKIGQRAWIDRDDLFRVRIGPFATRDLAVEARSALEANGISAIVMAE